MENISVAVIGGAGFLGQHIIRELQIWNNEEADQRRLNATTGSEAQNYVTVNLNGEPTESSLESDDSELLDAGELRHHEFNIKEIRILDIKRFEPFLEFSASPPLSFHTCDICLESEVSEALDGVDVVFHCAASIDDVMVCSLGNKIEEDKYWEINLEGSENIVSACKRNNVRALIYTSTLSVVLGRKKIVSQTESFTPSVDETKLLLGSYARSRKRAEDFILNAHKTVTENDKELVTTALRPVALYGEGDTRFIPSLISMAQEAGGKLPSIGGPMAYHQLTYAGNAAYAHVCAMIHLLEGAVHPLRDCGGLPIYISDDSPMGTSEEVLRPFLNNFGLSVTAPTFPVFIQLLLTFFLGLWLMVWEKLGWPSRWKFAIPSAQLQNLAGTTTVVSRVRAELSLGFKPKYSWDQAKQASLEYYERFVEEKALKRWGITS